MLCMGRHTGIESKHTPARGAPRAGVAYSRVVNAYPHLLAGYDLVGAEDLGRPLSDLVPELFWFRKQCAQEGVNIPFFFHAGETLGWRLAG